MKHVHDNQCREKEGGERDGGAARGEGGSKRMTNGAKKGHEVFHIMTHLQQPPLSSSFCSIWGTGINSFGGVAPTPPVSTA